MSKRGRSLDGSRPPTRRMSWTSSVDETCIKKKKIPLESVKDLFSSLFPHEMQSPPPLTRREGGGRGFTEKSQEKGEEKKRKRRWEKLPRRMTGNLYLLPYGIQTHPKLPQQKKKAISSSLSAENLFHNLDFTSPFSLSPKKPSGLSQTWWIKQNTFFFFSEGGRGDSTHEPWIHKHGRACLRICSGLAPTQITLLSIWISFLSCEPGFFCSSLGKIYMSFLLSLLPYFTSSRSYRN